MRREEGKGGGREGDGRGTGGGWEEKGGEEKEEEGKGGEEKGGEEKGGEEKGGEEKGERVKLCVWCAGRKGYRDISFVPLLLHPYLSSDFPGASWRAH